MGCTLERGVPLSGQCNSMASQKTLGRPFPSQVSTANFTSLCSDERHDRFDTCYVMRDIMVSKIGDGFHFGLIRYLFHVELTLSSSQPFIH